MFTGQMHAFVARANILELEKQAVRGVELELRKAPKEASRHPRPRNEPQ